MANEVEYESRPGDDLRLIKDDLDVVDFDRDSNVSKEMKRGATVRGMVEKRQPGQIV